MPKRSCRHNCNRCHEQSSQIGCRVHTQGGHGTARFLEGFLQASSKEMLLRQGFLEGFLEGFQSGQGFLEGFLEGRLS